jgi:Activator of Hsp90 ATPase homolog 1-like protein
MTAETATLSIRKVIRVPLPLGRAFELFTAEAGSWWPTLTHSIHEGDVAELVWEAREGGRLYEVTTSGEQADWADVLVWDPPSRFVLAWRVNPARPVTEVEVTFTEEGDSTRVELEHRGWPEESEGDRFDGYDKGWDYVLGRFEDAAGA